MFKLCQCSGEWAGRGGAVRRQPGGRAAHCPPLPCLSLQSMLTAPFQVTQLKKTQPPMAAATAAVLGRAALLESCFCTCPVAQSCCVRMTFYLPGSFYF